MTLIYVDVSRTLNMKYALYVFSFAVLCIGTGCSEKLEVPDWLLGTWKSDRAKTLAYIESNIALPENIKQWFRDSAELGQLINVFEKQGYASYPENDVPDKIETSPYTDIKINDGSVTFSTNVEMLDTSITSTIFPEGDCYYLETGGGSLREYFCRYGE